MKSKIINKNLFSILPMSKEEMGTEGSKLTICYSFIDTAHGEMLVASTTKGVCYLAFVTDDQEKVMRELKQLFAEANFKAEADLFQRNVLAVLSNSKTAIEIPLHVKGTDFQLEVWNELLNIPFGETVSYREVAAAIQKPKACRAVGTAIGSNPVSVLIPCHRVLRTDGTLGGYHWGLDCKKRLLEYEKKDI